MRKKKRRLKKWVLFLFIIIIIVIVYLGVTKLFNSDSDISTKKSKKEKEVEKLKIIDQDSDSRVIAVMINNRHAAWPHAGLQESFLNYEIIVEGGVTRMLALYKDASLEKIGSVRSSRPYFLDYVLENDAIYVHWGGSDEAYADISSLGVDHLDGMDYEGSYFFRDNSLDKSSEHTGFTKTSMILEGIKDLNIRDTSKESTVFKYSVKEIDLSKREDAIPASNVFINYSFYTGTNYVYNESEKVYYRSMLDEDVDTPHVDAITGKQYYTKNIITYQVNNRSVDDYGRQEIDNVGSGDGYYITNGYAVPITWEKSSRGSKTVYRYKSDGEEIQLNDGNTWVQIQPTDETLEITGNTSISEE